MNKPLEQALSCYGDKSASRFFMPGHKGTAYADFLPALSYDVTELDETGNLYHTDGVIAESQDEAAQAVGVPALLYSAGGSTLCIQALLAAFFKKGDRILLPRASHKAAIHAMGLLEMEPLWIPSPSGLCARADTEQFTMRIRSNECDGVFITSPDYFGVCADIKAISAACKQAGIPLIVDSAHGGHFPLLGIPSPIDMGADAACVSLHKTLPALTGAAAVYLAKSEKADAVRHWMSVFGSSSPSYLIMLSIERCFAYMDTPSAPQDWRALSELCKKLRQSALSLFPSTDDPTRLVMNLSGLDIHHIKQLAVINRLTPELLDARSAIFIPSPLNTKDDFNRLECFVQTVDKMARKPAGHTVLTLPEAMLPLREALLAPKETVPVDRAPGRICAEVVSICPPATVLLAPGEKIEPKTLDLFRDYGIFTVNVIK